MACSVGIDISADGIRIVQLSRRSGRLSVLGTYAKEAQPQEPSAASAGPQTQDFAPLLTEAIHEARLKTSAAVVVGLPHSEVFFSSLTTELTRREDVRRLLQFELEDDFPLPFEDLVADLCSCRRIEEDRYEYLIAAACRRQIDAWTQTFDSAGRRCSVLSADVVALDAVADLTGQHGDDRPAILLYADGRRAILGLLCDGVIACARHLPCTGDAEAVAVMSAREVELMLRTTLGRQYQHPVRILLSGPDEFIGELCTKLSQATGHDVVGCSTADCQDRSMALDGQFTIALGLALIGLGSRSGRLNFLNADPAHADRVARSKARRAGIVSAVLVVGILALLGLRAVGQWRALGAERARLTREIRAVFTETFPGQKKIVNEMAQMNESLTSLRKQRDALASVTGKRVRPLRVLHILSEEMTSESGIGISSLSIRDKTVRVAGTGGSFESVEQFVNELRLVPDFDSVEMEDLALNRGRDRPEFRLVISVKAGEQ
ncbi:MAG: pilus assembly protein PilM [Sedimentisphaerales bacterium]|nr:pilus assembly protein PilM [Sedimentisphaerales bacterium]